MTFTPSGQIAKCRNPTHFSRGMNSTSFEEDLVGVDGLADTTNSPEGSGEWTVNEDLWTNVTGDENGIYLSGNVTLFIKYKSKEKKLTFYQLNKKHFYIYI